MNIKIIIDDIYKNRPARVYIEYAPTIRSERQGLKVMHCKEFGKLVSEKYQRMHDISRRIYSVDGLSPTIHTMQGGNTELKVAIEEKNPFIVASRGRNPENPSDRTAGIKTEQRLEPNTQGISNTLTSVQKDNYVAEPINDQDGLCRTIKAQYQQTSRANLCRQGTFGATGVRKEYRIRKLTPKECWRLMGFSDEDFEKAAYYTAEEVEKLNLRTSKKHKDLPQDAKIERVSNSQLYKQAGNSIVVNVLMGIFWELLM